MTGGKLGSRPAAIATQRLFAMRGVGSFEVITVRSARYTILGAPISYAFDNPERPAILLIGYVCTTTIGGEKSRRFGHLVHDDFEVSRLSGLDLHALRLVACAKQSVSPRRKVKVNYARAIGSFRSDDAFVRRIQNRHLTPGQSGVRFCPFLHELPGYRLHLEFAVLRCRLQIAAS